MAGSADKERIVIGFFVAKGLLYDPQARPFPQAKLDLTDVLDVAENIEPRVYEVLPAALLHFPRSFRNLSKLPTELVAIIAAIRRGESRNVTFRGIRYSDMKRWAERPLPDKRTKPTSEKRKMKAFRFKHSTLKLLSELAAAQSCTETDVIESLIETNATHTRRP